MHCSDYLLVRPRLGVLAQQLLNVLDAAHLAVDLLQHRRALLQPEQHVLLHERKLDVRRQLLQLRQLRIRLLDEPLLVLLAPQRQLGPRRVAARQALLRDRLLAVRQHRDALLVLPQLIALVLHVQDRPARELTVRMSQGDMPTHLSWAEILFELPELPMLSHQRTSMRL